MPHAQFDPALTVGMFICDYNNIWHKYFPLCTKKGHWQIAQIIRSHHDGLRFSSIRGRLAELLNEETCIDRVQELKSAGLVTSSDEKIRSSTLLWATDKLVETFDGHAKEAFALLYAAAQSMDGTLPPPLAISASHATEQRLMSFFSRLKDAWAIGRANFLRTSMAHSPALRDKAVRDLMSFAYWHILLTAWIHRHPQGNNRQPYLVIEDFHSQIYLHLGVSMRATTGYVSNMVDWGFLERLNKEHGVKRNRYAVRMSEQAFAALGGNFNDIAALIINTAWDFKRSSSEVVPLQSAVVLPFQGRV